MFIGDKTGDIGRSKGQRAILPADNAEGNDGTAIQIALCNIGHFKNNIGIDAATGVHAAFCRYYFTGNNVRGFSYQLFCGEGDLHRM